MRRSPGCPCLWVGSIIAMCAISLNPKKTATRQRDKTLRNGAISTYRMTFFPSRPLTWCILVIRRLIAFVYPNSKNTATGRRDKILLIRVLTSYGRTSIQLTSSNLVYPGNPQFNRLYQLAHIRTNVTEKRRILVNKHIFELTSPKTYESRLARQFSAWFTIYSHFNEATGSAVAAFNA